MIDSHDDIKGEGGGGGVVGGGGGFDDGPGRAPGGNGDHASSS